MNPEYRRSSRPSSRAHSPLLDRLLRSAVRRLRLGSVLPLKRVMAVYGGSDKAAHGYAPHYDRHFRSFKHRRNLVLEIGIGGYDSPVAGRSLQIWRDYFPRSFIIGIDLYPKRLDLGPRVATHQADQSSLVDLTRVMDLQERFPNIVIDDGSHNANHVLASFAYFFPQMPTGSIYVIEDLHASYWPEYGGDLHPSEQTAVGLLRRLITSVQAGHASFSGSGKGDPACYASDPDVLELHVYPGIAFIIK